MKALCQGFSGEEISLCITGHAKTARVHSHKTKISPTKCLQQEWLHVPGGPHRWPRLTRLIQFRNAALVWQGKWALKAFPVVAAVLVIARRAGNKGSAELSLHFPQAQLLALDILKGALQ